MWPAQIRYSKSSTDISQVRIDDLRARSRSISNISFNKHVVYNVNVSGAQKVDDEEEDDDDDEWKKKRTDDDKPKPVFTSDSCIKWTKILAISMLRLMVVAFWGWVLMSMLNVFRTTENAFDKRHAVIPRDVRLDSAYKYYVTSIKAEELTLNVLVEGPFITSLQQSREYNEEKMKSAETKKYVFVVTLERWVYPKKPDDTDRRTLKRPANPDTHPAAFAKLVMKNETGKTHMFPLDYNNYPRDARVTLPKRAVNTSRRFDASGEPEISRRADDDKSVYYAIGFGVDKSQEKAIPFSMSYKVDPITMRTRVLIGVIPLIVFSALVALQINRGVAAFVATATAAGGWVKTGEGVKIVNLLQWITADIIFYVFFVNLLTSLLVETKVYSYLAYQYVRLTRLNFWASVILINVLAGFLPMWFNNIYVVSLLFPLTIRLMELVGADPVPVILNMVFMCNISGRAFVGTFAAKLLLNHIEAINMEFGLNKLMKTMMRGAMTVAVVTALVFLLLYYTFAPHRLPSHREVEENRHLMSLWYRYSLTIPNVSVRYHTIKRKITGVRKHLYQEIIWLTKLKKPYDFPKNKKTTNERLREMAPDNKIENCFLLVKCIILMALSIGLLVPYIYNIELKTIWTTEEMRLGYIALYSIVLTLFFVHSRDFELLLKKIDWQSLLVFLALNVITSVFYLLTKHMDDFLWKTYGATMVAIKRIKKVHIVFAQLLAYTSVSGLFNEYVMFHGFLDTIMMYAAFKGFDSVNEILAGFWYLTGYWGHVTYLGTGPNIVVSGMLEQQGHRITFYGWMKYGLSIALINVILVYFYILLRYLV